MSLRMARVFLAGFPFGGATQQVFLGHHFQNGANVLGHAAVNEDKAFGEFLAGFGRGLAQVKYMMRGHEAAAG